MLGNFIFSSTNTEAWRPFCWAHGGSAPLPSADKMSLKQFKLKTRIKIMVMLIMSCIIQPCSC